MSRGSSGHFANGGVGYFAHNDRSTKTNNAIFSDEKNEIDRSAKESFKLYRDELAKRAEAYQLRTNQKLQKNTITHKSLIINLEAHHTLKDLEAVKEYLEKSLDTKVLQVAIHRDEGHIDENNNAIKNYHAHIEMMGIDGYGISISQHQNKDKSNTRVKQTRSERLDSKFYSEFQTFLADTLKMQRGKLGSKAKRLDTYEYKEHAKRSAEAKQDIKLTVTELKKQIEQYRKDLAAKNAELQIYKQSDYADISQLKKLVKKSNVDEIFYEFVKLQNKNAEKEQEARELRAENEKLSEKAKERKEKIKELQEDLEFAIDTQNEFRQKALELMNKEPEIKTVEKIVEKPITKEVEALSTVKYRDSDEYMPWKQVAIMEQKAKNKAKKELINARETIFKHETTISTLKAEISSHKQDMSVLKRENRELESEVSTLKTKNSVLKRENSSLNAERSDKESAEVSKLRNKLTNAGEEAKEQKQKRDELEKYLLSIAEMSGVKKKDLTTYENVTNKIITNIKTLRTKLRTIAEALSVKVSDSVEVFVLKIKSLFRNSRSEATQTQEVEELKEQIKELEETNDMLHHAVQSMQKGQELKPVESQNQSQKFS